MNVDPVAAGELTLDSNRLQAWLGRTQQTHDVISASVISRMDALLGQPVSLNYPKIVPPLWHWLFFHPAVATQCLSADGHERLGDFLPPVALPRRMWAGGRLWFHHPIPLHATATRHSVITQINRKRGRSGELCFVTVQHSVVADGVECLVEEHDIVYREAKPLSVKGQTAAVSGKQAAVPGKQEVEASANLIRGPDDSGCWHVTPSVTTLFRYSALTFNSHRIHYDRLYCQTEEGYPGLVFHGPLTATLLAHVIMQQQPQAQLQRFEFRALGALFDTQGFCIKIDGEANPLSVTAYDPAGHVAMLATATLAD